MRKLNVAIALGLVAALAGGALVLAYGSKVEARIADGRETARVVVAKQPLDVGTPSDGLTASTEVRDVPRAYLVDGALPSLDAVTGMTLLAPVPTGAQLTRSAFGSPSDVGSLKPSQGNVALAVGVDLVPGVARYITAPGMVDLFVTYPERGSGGGPPGAPGQPNAASSRTKLFASGIRVMSVSVAPPPEGRDDAAKDSNAPLAKSDQVIAVLDVSPGDAERIVNSATLGKLYLGLSAGERHVTPTGATPDDVVRSNR